MWGFFKGLATSWLTTSQRRQQAKETTKQTQIKQTIAELGNADARVTLNQIDALSSHWLKWGLRIFCAWFSAILYFAYVTGLIEWMGWTHIHTTEINNLFYYLIGYGGVRTIEKCTQHVKDKSPRSRRRR